MDWIDAAQDAAAIALGKLLSQDARLIELDCALPDVFVPERFEGREAVCEGFRFEIDCLSPTAFAPLAGVLGQPATLRLRRADGSLRAWNGLITHTSALGSDGGLARYRLTLEPWTALLRLRTNALIFQDLDVLGVVTRVFADYPQASWRADVTQTMPRRSITTQYRESDWDFVTRLLAERGLAWRIDHAGESHTLVIHDAEASAPRAQPANVRYHRIDATESMDAIGRFAETHGLAPDAVAVASWDASAVEATSATTEAPDPAGAVASREVFHAGHAGRFANRGEADQAGRLLLDALRLPRTLQAGSGSERGMAPGHAFTLLQHPELSGQSFVPLVVEHAASNNLGSGIAALLDAPDMERGSYRNRLLTVTEGVPIVPTPCQKPLAPGAQTAMVVGLPDAAITSSRDHQVRIQFAWQRGATPNRGGLTEAASGAFPEGHAPGDHTSGTWVRVAEWLAGPNWGSHTLPRVGSEVLVEFLHADIDQPIVTGQLYNGDVAPPFAAGHDATANHIGTLSGLHSQSLDGGGTQQWVMDDAPGQLRQRLHSTLADARLELGYLVEHGNEQRGGLRGQGFDLATLGWGNLRAGQGVLLSTTLRSNAASTQMDDAEAISQLLGAEQTAQALDEALGHHDVPGLKANDPLRAFTKTVESTADESTPDNGSAGAAPKPFGAAAILAEGPDRIAIATPKSALAYAGGHLHLTSQDDAHLAAGQTLAGVSGGHVAFFAQQGPLRAIAANGQVSLQAHTGTLELLADQSVTITATDERVEVLAKEKIVLQAGQSAITLRGTDITFTCPGNFTVKATENPFLGAASGAASITSLPNATEKLDHWIEIDHRDVDNDAFAGMAYKIFFEGGQTVSGTLDDDGHARHDGVPTKATKVEYELPEPKDDAPWEPIRALTRAAHSKFG
ncbi:type VI secretion system Vgr family protein [Aerolutibacter daejeonensis]|uniref:type VI secretion system Vgr family protein n=1 Tax=Aerolutibacter daejeonensis TaxID=346181 RepID=UPI000A0308BC|nr:type VI secretion system Vgr family protein [Lysobacter daejeonensis]